MPAVDFTHLMQAYLLARRLSDDPQMLDADRACCYIIATLIREASGEAAATWGNVYAREPAADHSSDRRWDVWAGEKAGSRAWRR
jgi:hypothetical protein